MARPLFGMSLIAELERDQLHSSDIAAVLGELARRFDEEGIPFAVIGALAMRHHGYVRHTEDIDILTTRDGLDRIHARLVGRGYRPRFPGSRKKLRETSRHVDVDLIAAGERGGPEHLAFVFPDPQGEGFSQIEGLRIPDLPTLVTLKLVAGASPHRLRDLADVLELIRANRLDESFAPRVIPEVRAKYLELVESSRQGPDAESDGRVDSSPSG